jgi:hypothetical protein
MAGSMNQQQQFAMEYLREKNRVLKEQLAADGFGSTTISAGVWRPKQNAWAAEFWRRSPAS